MSAMKPPARKPKRAASTWRGDSRIAQSVSANAFAEKPDGVGTVRALATRELGSNNAFRVVMREAMVGLVNGLAFAVITGIAAVAWFKIPGLGIVIGLAIVCNLVAGALGGILVPIVLERVRDDPAVASGTFVTTITDVVGFFSFLGIATLWFGLK